MYDNDSKGISYIAGFFVLIAFSIAALFLAKEITDPIWQNMTGKTMEALKALRKSQIGPEDSLAMRLMQTITAIVGFFIPAVLAAYVLNRKPFKLLGFPGNIKPGQAALVILIMLSGMIVSASLAYFNERIPISGEWRVQFDKMEADYNKQVEAIVSLKNIKDYILALIIMGFLPALCEETLFRGGLQNFLTRATKIPWIAIVIVSIIFSLAHFSFYGFLTRFFLGVVLGLIYYYSGRLWLSILAHFINNTLIITILYSYTRQGKPINEAMQEETVGFWGIIALPVVIGLFIVFKNMSPGKRRIA
jgi:membrane protease YdiL (CAAX protease family)